MLGVLGRSLSSQLMAMFQSMLKDLIDGPAKSIWLRQGLPPDDLQNLYLTEAPDPSVDSSFKLGTAAQVLPRRDYTHHPANDVYLSPP